MKKTAEIDHMTVLKPKLMNWKSQNDADLFLDMTVDVVQLIDDKLAKKGPNQSSLIVLMNR